MRAKGLQAQLAEKVGEVRGDDGTAWRSLRYLAEVRGPENLRGFLLNFMILI